MAIFTGRIERAIALAMRAHETQVRKGDGQLPYMVHPVTVALILSRYTGDEERSSRVSSTTPWRTRS